MTIELTLRNMSCGHCVKTVTETVKQIDPAADPNEAAPHSLRRWARELLAPQMPLSAAAPARAAASLN